MVRCERMRKLLTTANIYRDDREILTRKKESTALSEYKLMNVAIYLLSQCTDIEIVDTFHELQKRTFKEKVVK